MLEMGAFFFHNTLSLGTGAILVVGGMMVGATIGVIICGLLQAAKTHDLPRTAPIVMSHRNPGLMLVRR